MIGGKPHRHHAWRLGLSCMLNSAAYRQVDMRTRSGCSVCVCFREESEDEDVQSFASGMA